MSSCEICPILKTRNDGRDTVVFETEYWRGVLDSDQRSLGKMFVTLLEHRESIAELSQPQVAELFVVMRGLERAIRDAYQPTHVNWQCLMNNAVAAGQPTHVHWHFQPRYDGERVVKDEVFTDGTDTKATHVVEPEILEQVRQDIVDRLEVGG